MNGAQTLDQVPPPPRKEGCGCCAAGCGTLAFIGIALVALLIGALWYLYARTVDTLTDPHPTAVQLEEPNEAQFAAANQKFQTLQNATQTGEVVTVEFTADDLNALIARHPDEMWRDMRGKVRVAIADSIATVDMSVPLTQVRLPRVQNRFFVGRAEFGFAYNDDGFRFAPRVVEAGGVTIGEDVWNELAGTFDTYFNQEWDREQRERPARAEDRFWRQIRSAEVTGDRLVVTTREGLEQER
jgi:hypothetical protein